MVGPSLHCSSSSSATHILPLTALKVRRSRFCSHRFSHRNICWPVRTTPTCPRGSLPFAWPVHDPHTHPDRLPLHNRPVQRSECRFRWAACQTPRVASSRGARDRCTLACRLLAALRPAVRLGHVRCSAQVIAAGVDTNASARVSGVVRIFIRVSVVVRTLIRLCISHGGV